MRYVWIWLVILLTGCAHGDEIMKQPREFGRTYGEVIETYNGGAEWGVYDEHNMGWLLTPEEGDTVSLLIRIGPMPDKNLRYILCSGGARKEVTGAVFTGISNYSTGRWAWNDVGIEGWCKDDEGNVLYDWFVGFDMGNVEQPVSPDGYIYFLVVARGPADARVSNLPFVTWEDIGEE